MLGGGPPPLVATRTVPAPQYQACSGQVGGSGGGASWGREEIQEYQLLAAFLPQEMTPLTSSPISLTPQHCKPGGVCTDLCCPCHIILSPGLSFPRPNPYFEKNSRSHCLDLPPLPQKPGDRDQTDCPKLDPLFQISILRHFPSHTPRRFEAASRLPLCATFNQAFSHQLFYSFPIFLCYLPPLPTTFTSHLTTWN